MVGTCSDNDDSTGKVVRSFTGSMSASEAEAGVLSTALAAGWKPVDDASASHSGQTTTVARHFSKPFGPWTSTMTVQWTNYSSEHDGLGPPFEVDLIAYVPPTSGC
jgi:hypothetical protein